MRHCKRAMRSGRYRRMRSIRWQLRYARVFSEALGRPIRYRDVPLPAWNGGLRQARYPEYVVRHLSAMADLTRQGRYDRMTDTYYKLTGEAPTSMRDFVKLHAADFKQRGAAHS